MRIRLMVLASLCIGIEPTIPNVAGRSRTAADLHQDHAKAGELSIVINGAESPELIPDDHAYKHYLTALAVPDEPTVEQFAARSARLAPLGLSTEDSQAFLEAIRGLHADLEAASQADVAATDTEGGRSLLQPRRHRALEQTRDGVLGALSPDGIRKLDRHIQEYVKARIVIYGDGGP